VEQKFAIRGVLACLAVATGMWTPIYAGACDLALAMAVDVSGSVDPQEYRIQMDGLAAGLRDGVVSEALVKAEAQVALVHWTGSSRQALTIPWRQIRTFEDIDRFADEVEIAERPWRNFSTAIGEALQFTLKKTALVPGCRRIVIDVSGDGVSNEGVEPIHILPAIRAANVTVNALVIEGTDEDLTGYFWENVISGEGSFVVTANGFEQYAEKMRQKLVRETTVQVSRLQVVD
jgi:Ca-activated chloride channel family protein